MTDAEALDRVLTRRYSCRAFRPDPVPRDQIEAVVAMAQKIPSWCNAQPWEVIVTGAEETGRLRRALQDEIKTAQFAPDIAFPAAYDGVYQERRRNCGWQLYHAVGIEKGDRDGSARQMRENFSFFGAPHVALITTPRALGTYGVLDCGAFVTAFALCAAAHGLDTIPQAALAGYAPFFRDRYDIDATRDFLCGISIGYGDDSHPANGFRTERASVDEVIDWRM